MADDWRHDMMRRHPDLFGRSGFPAVGDGWRDLLERALTRIRAAITPEPAGSGIRIVQIKEKFGALRLYYNGRELSRKAAAEVEEAIALAEARSACTCEQCGAEGGLYVKGGWYATRCPQHGEGEPVPFKFGWDNLRIVRTVRGGKFHLKSCRRYDRERDVFIDVLPPDDLDEEA